MSDTDGSHTLAASPPPAAVPGADHEYIHTNTASVYIGWGLDQKRFTVHTALIENRCALFRRITGFQDNRANLPDACPKIFDFYLHIVYTGVATIEGTRYAPGPDADADDIMRKYCRAHIFAEGMGDCAAANSIIDAMIAYSVQVQTVLSVRNVDLVFANAVESSPLRRLAIEMWAYAVKDGREHDWSGLPRCFLVEVLEEKVRAEKRGVEAGIGVGEAFGYEFIAADAGRYHVFDELHPGPLV